MISLLLLPFLFKLASAEWVNITVVTDGVQEGAVCLDGTPPAYHLARGSGSSSKNWLVFLQGGGWCSSMEECAQRSMTSLGSSALMEDTAYFSGMLSNSLDYNPDFYNWNRVYVRYCDGASFTGNVHLPVNISSSKPQAELTFRGSRIWKAVIRDLLTKGMKSAENALLSGCSAGGLATILNCNSFQSLLPQETDVKCVGDAGFFIDTQDVIGNLSFREFYADVFHLHNVTKQLPRACTRKHGPLCFFPQYVLPYIKVPLFILNPAYDVWQIQNILAPGTEWSTCKTNPPANCSSSQMKTLQGFRLKFLGALQYALDDVKMGVYINSCFTHCQAEDDFGWNHAKSDNETIREAVGNWYFERSRNKIVDNPFPSNPTCK